MNFGPKCDELGGGLGGGGGMHDDQLHNRYCLEILFE